MIRSREEMAETFHERAGLREISDAAGYSPFHYQREFAALFGQTPAEFVRELRVARARQLLLQSGMHVSEICCEVGYASRTTFTREFARKHGQPPTEFRRIYSVPGTWQSKLIPFCFLPTRKI
ncbi:AraC family transcriptional regulator [bacterium]|nr:MAG: AraC family transcriptional regulator [bacterium]